MEQSFHGYKFDGDPDALKMLSNFDDEEIATIAYCVKNKGKAKIRDTKHDISYEFTKTQNDIYMVSQVSHNSSWF